MRNDEALAYLERCLAADRLAQAYILAGNPRADGAWLAEQLLLRLFCESRKDRPCSHCRCCRQVCAHTHPDILWIEPQKRSRIISIDQVRDLQRVVFQTSFAGGWKACVLVAADRLGPEASNAFLKALEEPPDRCLFLLLTESPQSLLPTIVSRSQQVRLSARPAEVPEAWSQELFSVLVQVGAGHRPGPRLPAVATLGHADRLLALLRTIREAVQQEAEAEQAEDHEETDDILNARATSRYREIRAGIMRSLLLWHRDILLLLCGANDDDLCYPDRAESTRALAKRLTVRQALGNIQVVEKMNSQLEKNLPEGLVLSSAFGELARSR